MDFLDSLSDDKREMLLNFQAITGIEDLNKVFKTLDDHSWSLEAAIQSTFEESGSIVSKSTSRRNPSILAEQATPAGTTLASPVSPSTYKISNTRTFSILSLLFLPLTISYKVAFAVFAFTMSIFPFTAGLLPSRKAVTSVRRPWSNDKKAVAARFLLNFEQNYGNRHPEFYQGTYSQALEQAKRDGRCLLVVLHSEDHDDTEVFCRTILTSDALISFLAEKHVLIWAGDILEEEAFQVSQVLAATRYPFMSLVALQGSRMIVVDRIEGPASVDSLLENLSRLLARVEPQLAAVRAERAARDSARLIRQQQDDAYQASLLADQEKERQTAEAAMKARREQEEAALAEQERLSRIQEIKKRRAKLAEKITAEPPLNEPGQAKINVRLPNGERVIRRYRGSDKVEALFAFIGAKNLSPLSEEADFIFASTFPRKLYTNRSETMQEAGLVPNASLVIEEAESNE